jgi:hypothetical protein
MLTPSNVQHGNHNIVGTGVGFVDGCTLVEDGIDAISIPVNWVSDTEVNWDIQANTHPPGTHEFAIRNPNLQLSNALPLVVGEIPQPTLTQINPNPTVQPGAPTRFIGTNFAIGCKMVMDGIDKVVTFISSTEVTFAVPDDAAYLGEWDTYIENIDGKQTNVMVWTIKDQLVLTDLAPDTTDYGKSTETTYTGSGFEAGAVVKDGYSGGRALTVDSPTKARATWTFNDRAYPSLMHSVWNPDGRSSGALPQNYQEPAPTLTDITPDQVYFGRSTRINFTGTGFRGTQGQFVLSGYGYYTCYFTSATTGYLDTSLIASSPNATIAVKNTTGNATWSNSLPLTGWDKPRFSSINPASGTLADQKTNWPFDVYGSQFIGPMILEFHESGFRIFTSTAQAITNAGQARITMNIGEGAGTYSECCLYADVRNGDKNNAVRSDYFTYQFLAG